MAMKASSVALPPVTEPLCRVTRRPSCSRGCLEHATVGRDTRQLVGGCIRDHHTRREGERACQPTPPGLCLAGSTHPASRHYRRGSAGAPRWGSVPSLLDRTLLMVGVPPLSQPRMMTASPLPAATGDAIAAVVSVALPSTLLSATPEPVDRSRRLRPLFAKTPALTK